MIYSVMLYVLLLGFAVGMITRLAGRKSVQDELAKYAEDVDLAAVELTVDMRSVIEVLVEA